MNTERDKFLTEAMEECWHEFIVDNSSIEWDERTTFDEADAICSKCNEHCKTWREDRTGYAILGDKHLVWQFPSYVYNNFSTPDGFFKLWDWVSNQENMICGLGSRNNGKELK